MQTFNIRRSTIVSLSRIFVAYRIQSLRQSGIESFTMPELLGSSWDEELIPFYQLYNENGKVAGAEMGKIVSQEAKKLGLTSVKEDRRGKLNSITRHYFKTA